MKQGDIIIYGCVIIGAGIGLTMDNAIPGVLIGLGAGYLLKKMFHKEE
ncbi:molecular chaperone DnaJ [Paenibacillus sp. FJAT-26967]|nr:molecular chaperone DnaJ [Paenibacillus sp. FJAT-26967]